MSYPDTVAAVRPIRHAPQPIADQRRDQRRREMSALEALEWAFGREKVSLDLPDPRSAEERGSGFGMEHVLLERARLGRVRIDTSIGRSSAHDDAEVIAAVLSALPQAVGGKRMAIRIAELARAGRRPDWMPDAQPRLEPLALNGRGTAKTEVCEILRVKRRVRTGARGDRWFNRKVEVRWCPCRWMPDLAQISAARSAYVRWWIALDRVRANLSAGGKLRSLTITSTMPAASPWTKKQG
ncbi:hypothetical protein AAD018_011445 [Aestuariibius insulae]|uniref:hypothetical protein n=1 Tax=Aestuariibius insulae TaxID=2058287 RepID=UPI00398F3E2C